MRATVPTCRPTCHDHKRYAAGCAGCMRAVRLYRNYQRLREERGETRHIDKTGTVRRIQAMRRMGWTLPAIARGAGTGRTALVELLSERRPKTHVLLAQRIKAFYDANSLTFGGNTRALRIATNAGWPAPLDWDDDSIDDPAAGPVLERKAELPVRA